MIITEKVAWISTEEAARWLRFENPNVVIKLIRKDGQGVLVEVDPKDGRPDPIPLGINSADLAGLGRFLLAVAVAQGQEITRPKVEP